jgi:hypothetical protein
LSSRRTAIRKKKDVLGWFDFNSLYEKEWTYSQTGRHF